jgi:hypothetical protein
VWGGSEVRMERSGRSSNAYKCSDRVAAISGCVSLRHVPSGRMGKCEVGRHELIRACWVSLLAYRRWTR